MISLQVSMPSLHLEEQESDSAFSLSAVSEMRVKPCWPNNDYCWKLDPKLTTLLISAIQSHQLTE